MEILTKLYEEILAFFSMKKFFFGIFGDNVSSSFFLEFFFSLSFHDKLTL